MGLTKQLFNETRERFPVDDEYTGIEFFYVPNNEKEMETPNETDALKQRIINVKKELPGSVVPLFIKIHPDFDTYKKKSRITNVLQLRIADLDITEKLERMAEQIKKMK